MERRNGPQTQTSSGQQQQQQQSRNSNEEDGRPRPKKLRRSTRACDFCHRRSIRCKPSSVAARCQNCVDFDVVCAYDRPAKKRGVKAAAGSRESPSRDSTQHANLLLHLTHENVHPQNKGSQYQGSGNVSDAAGDSLVEPDALFEFPLRQVYREMVLTHGNQISHLVELYFETVYPVFPLFHQPTLVRNVLSKMHHSNQALFSTVMSICALVSARGRDDLILSRRLARNSSTQPNAELFFAAARDTLPAALGEMTGLGGLGRDYADQESLDYMRTCAMLALYGIQIGKIDVLHQYLGIYNSVVAMDGLHDEKNWPKALGLVESEERRRLFWSMFRLEVYRSAVWGGVVRCKEAHSRVAYPVEVDDYDFCEGGFQTEAYGSNGWVPNPVLNPDPSCWLHGWNFTTDMYRILEHILTDLPRQPPLDIGVFFPSSLYRRNAPLISVVLEKVMYAHAQLPERFKRVEPAVRDMRKDACSFQATNIIATLQLIRLILFTSEESTTSEKCEIVQVLLDEFARIPLSCVVAISSPLIYHFAGIGSLIGSVIDGPLDEINLIQVRSALNSMADLLARLEERITPAVGAAFRIRALIVRIDSYVHNIRHSNHNYPQSIDNTNSPGFPTPMSAPIESSHLSNVDPALQDLPIPRWEGQVFPQGPNQSYYENLRQDTNGAVESPGNGENLSFQIPPEILQDRPWFIDAAQWSGVVR